MDPSDAQGAGQHGQSQAQADYQPQQSYQGYPQQFWPQQPAASYDYGYHQPYYDQYGYADPAQQQQQAPLHPWQVQAEAQPPSQLQQPEHQPFFPPQQAQPPIQPEDQAPGTQQYTQLPEPTEQALSFDPASQPALPPDSPPPLPPLPDQEAEPAEASVSPIAATPKQFQDPAQHFGHLPAQAFAPAQSSASQIPAQLEQAQPQYGHPPAQVFAPAHPQAYSSPQIQDYRAAQVQPHPHAGGWHEQAALGMSAPYWAHMQHPSFQEHQMQAPPQAAPPPDPAVSAAALFLPPGRHSRPRKLAIILRGLPGSGKSHSARLIKDLETLHGQGPPRIHSLDDYFVTDVEKDDPADGHKSKRHKVRTQEYVYEPELEGAYQRSLLKAFSSTVQSARFEVVIVDAPNLQLDDFKEFWAQGEGAGYQVYVARPLERDPAVCAQRSTHGRTLDEITALAPTWEDAPVTYPQLNLRPLLSPAQQEAQDTAIEEVDMEEEPEAAPLRGGAADADGAATAPPFSRWSSMGEEEPEPERELPLQPRKPRKIQALKGILSTAISKARRKRLLTWKDESPAQDGQPAQLVDVRVLAGLGPPKQTTGHSFAEQAQVHRKSEQHLFRELLLGGGPPS